ncbi:hypothetical protein NPIL_536591 [Nephila pilipes]|uniref:Uncharacterized protein n=1 Tax=Nephila pilipes TaxID=299642 RepID=A0A8X6TQN6_NEPPI|nr:hypothetical protein NPIL_536591 [Nephila pilipes]
MHTFKRQVIKRKVVSLGKKHIIKGNGSHLRPKTDFHFSDLSQPNTEEVLLFLSRKIQRTGFFGEKPWRGLGTPPPPICLHIGKICSKFHERIRRRPTEKNLSNRRMVE